MKKLKIILFVAGVAFLAAGVWLQDVWATFNAITAPNRVTCGGLTWSYINEEVFVPLHHSTQTGILLKLMGFGILFSLFFAKLHKTTKNRGISSTLPATMGLSSAICLAVFSVTAPVANSVRWAMEIVAAKMPAGLEVEQLQEALTHHFSGSSSAAGGAIPLALGLLLLSTALLVYRRRAWLGIAAPSLVPIMFLLTQRRAVSEEAHLSGMYIPPWGLFTVSAVVFSLTSLAIFVWAMIVRNRKPRKVSFLTIIVLTAAGLLALLFWLSAWGTGYSLNLIVPYFVGPPSVADLSPYVYWHLVLAFWLSVVLMLCSVVMPILCAFSLRHPPEEPDSSESPKKLPLPLVAGMIVIATFVTAGFFWLREDQYMASLREVSSVYGLPEFRCLKEVEHDIARIESDEGLQFMRGMLKNRREFYWHQFILTYLLHESRNPEAKAVVMETLADDANPVASAQACEVIRNALDWSDPSMTKDGCDMISSFLPQIPQAGTKLIQAMIGSAQVRSELVYWIFHICAKEKVKKFSLPKRLFGCKFPDSQFNFPNGFTIHYDRELGPADKKLVVKLLWCEPNSFRQTKDPVHGRIVLEGQGVKYRYVANEYCEILPDYQKLTEDLHNARINSGRLWVVLDVNHFVHAYHIGYVLHACAKAGITEASIPKPEIPY